MSLVNIPTAIGSALSSLTSHHGHHKKDVNGGGSSNPLNSTSASTSSDGQLSGSTQSLFGTLLDSVEQVVGLQTPTNTANAAKAPLTANALQAGIGAPASITATQLALRKV